MNSSGSDAKVYVFDAESSRQVFKMESREFVTFKNSRTYLKIQEQFPKFSIMYNREQLLVLKDARHLEI